LGGASYSTGGKPYINSALLSDVRHFELFLDYNIYGVKTIVVDANVMVGKGNTNEI
jgi:hypothetical protein